MRKIILFMLMLMPQARTLAAAGAKMMMEVHDDNASSARKGKTENAAILKNEIAIFPNPTLNNFTILGVNEHANITIEISDIAGRIVLKTKLAQQINISFLSKGVYVLKIFDGSHVIYKNNIIKL